MSRRCGRRPATAVEPVRLAAGSVSGGQVDYYAFGENLRRVVAAQADEGRPVAVGSPRRFRVLLDRSQRDVRPGQQARHDPGGAHPGPGADSSTRRLRAGARPAPRAAVPLRGRRTSGSGLAGAHMAAANSGGRLASAGMAVFPSVEDGYTIVEASKQRHKAAPLRNDRCNGQGARSPPQVATRLVAAPVSAVGGPAGCPGRAQWVGQHHVPAGRGVVGPSSQRRRITVGAGQRRSIAWLPVLARPAAAGRSPSRWR